jgi:hypothetical protein
MNPSISLAPQHKTHHLCVNNCFVCHNNQTANFALGRLRPQLTTDPATLPSQLHPAIPTVPAETLHNACPSPTYPHSGPSSLLASLSASHRVSLTRPFGSQRCDKTVRSNQIPDFGRQLGACDESKYTLSTYYFRALPLSQLSLLSTADLCFSAP